MKKYSFFEPFFALIIALFLFGFSGCGYKAPPTYDDSVVFEDENTVVKKKSSESK